MLGAMARGHGARRWRRRAFVGAAGLLLTTAALAVASGWFAAGVTATVAGRAYVLGVQQGAAWFAVGDRGQSAPGFWFDRFEPRWDWWFATARSPGASHARVPLWAVALGAGLTAWWTRPARTPAGRCPACGYDTAGVAGVCPECGAAPAEARRDARGGRGGRAG